MKFVTYRIWDREEENWRNETELYAVFPLTYTKEEIIITLTVDVWLLNIERQEIVIEDIIVADYYE